MVSGAFFTSCAVPSTLVTGDTANNTAKKITTALIVKILMVRELVKLSAQKRHAVPVWQRLQTEKSSPPKACLPL
jgi:hypothetical protein